MTTIEELTPDQRDARIRALEDSLDVNAPITADAIDALSPAGKDLRRQELLQSLGEKDASEERPRTPEDFNSLDKMIVDPKLANLRTDQLINSSLALSLRGVEFGKTEPIGWKETLEETRLSSLVPFLGSTLEAGRLFNLYKAVQRLSAPPGEDVYGELAKTGQRASDVPFFEPTLWDMESAKIPPEGFAAQERTRLRSQDEAIVTKWVLEYAERQERGVSIGGRIAEGVTFLPSFMLEFLATGPIFRSGNAAARTAATKLLGRAANHAVGKGAIWAAGAGFGTLLRTGVNVPRILRNAAQNMSPNIQITDDGVQVFANADTAPYKALLKGGLELYIENASEILGMPGRKAVLGASTRIANKFPIIKKITQEIGEKWIANRAGRTITKFFQASSTRLGWDGIIEEFGEERAGALMRAATGLDDWDKIIPTQEEFLVEAGILFFGAAGVNLATNQLFRTDRVPIPIERRTGLVGKQLDTKAIPKLTTEQTQRFLRSGLPIEQFIQQLPQVQPIPTAEAGDEAAIKKTTVVTEAKSIVGRTVQAGIEKLGDVAAFGFRNIGRTEDILGTKRWGTIGKKIQRSLQEIAARAAKNAGNMTQEVKRIYRGLDKTERTIVSQLADGAIEAKDQPRRFTARANLLRRQLDIMQNEAITLKMRTGELTGKAFPQVPNAKGKAFLAEADFRGAKSRRVFAWAQTQVNKGRFDNVDSAIAALQSYRKQRLRGAQGYLEGTRVIELDNDMRDWNPFNVLPGVIDNGWESIEAVRQWDTTGGVQFKSLKTDIERVRTEVGEAEARVLEDYIKAQFGQPTADPIARAISRQARNLQFVGKLAFSPLTITRNMLDRLQKGLAHGTFQNNIRATLQYPPFLNRWMKTSQKIEDEMIRQGAVLGHGHLSEGFQSGGKITQLFGKPFASSERGNQVFIAQVKKLQLIADFRSLHELGGEDGSVGKVFKRLNTILGRSREAIKARVLKDIPNEELVDMMAEEGQIWDDVLQEALHRTVVDLAFPLTLASKRIWWGNRPAFRMLAQFKIWPLDQTRFIYKDIINYTLGTGEISRLFRWIVGLWLGGEIYNIARDILLDRDESLAFTLTDPDGRNATDIANAIKKDLLDGGLVGMLADLAYGLSDWIFGPTVGSLETALKTVVQVDRDAVGTTAGLKKFLLQDIPALKQAQGVYDRLDRTFFDDDKRNLTGEYWKWRQRSFEFRDKKDQLSKTEKLLGSVLLGKQRRGITARSLSLELIARQVLVGDIDDAADYIEGVFEATPIEKISTLRTSFLQSMKSHSPIGNIARKDIPEFINQFSAEGQAEIKAMQVQWIKNYAAAYQLAGQRLKQKGFFEELIREAREQTQLKE